MNFIEAVTCLKNGECEGIQRTMQPYYRDNGNGTLVNIHGSGPVHIENILADDWELVKPVIRTEQREVVTYGVVIDGQIMMCDDDESECGVWMANNGGQVVKLAGSMPAPPEVNVEFFDDPVRNELWLAHISVDGPSVLCENEE